MNVVDEQIDATGKAFLATTIACARCHDHKFDPIPTADYYSMAGIFKSTSRAARPRQPRARSSTSTDKEALVKLSGFTAGGDEGAETDTSKLKDAKAGREAASAR